MKNGVVIALAMCLFSNVVNAEDFFRDCGDVSKESSYRLLNEYLSSTNNETHDQCQRLNDQEFLYTTNENIYYCNSANGTTLKCEENEEGHWFPGLSVVKRFKGKNSKQFVLFKTQRLSHGIYDDGYHAFFLVPKSVNQRGYKVFSFPDAGAFNGLYSDSGETCSDIDTNKEAVVSLDPPLQIISEYQSNVVVQFNQERTNCKTGEKSKQTLEYTWQNGSFQQTKNQLDKLSAKH